jgi:hypothetical protein
MNSLTVSITKDILVRSYRCGNENETDMIGNNCAIALALKDRFPNVFVSGTHIHPFGVEDSDFEIPLPVEAVNFIRRFDSLSDTPEERMGLPELEFEIQLIDELSYA